MSLREEFVPVSNTALTGAIETSYAHGAAKRLLDLIVTVPLLIAFAPLLGLIALFVRLDSKGPVIFKQTRLGLFGEPFQIFKFRTMHVLENGPVVVQATKNDSRVTRLGRFLRKTSLDELPQLFNVVNGDMSLIGPRPHPLALDRHYGALIQGYDERQNVRPGISGWAQVNGLRGETPTTDDMTNRVAFDAWYARHASLALDIQILFRTAGVVLSQKNAL
ncbi:MAG TPA: exopolysaccharide biosynthesis polyprenyl glycosylphosphotransferase [Rhizomicrobium sp.]|nr:exopolysaccharide biosynthesis polyprenyl glycosylphosphotransferase [Rhizomicrobium sp.]